MPLESRQLFFRVPRGFELQALHSPALLYDPGVHVLAFAFLFVANSVRRSTVPRVDATTVGKPAHFQFICLSFSFLLHQRWYIFILMRQRQMIGFQEFDNQFGELGHPICLVIALCYCRYYR